MQSTRPISLHNWQGGRRERLLINNKLDWYLHVSPVTNTAGGGGGDGQTGQTGAARIRTLTFSINSIFVWSPQEGGRRGVVVERGGGGGQFDNKVWLVALQLWPLAEQGRAQYLDLTGLGWAWKQIILVSQGLVQSLYWDGGSTTSWRQIFVAQLLHDGMQCDVWKVIIKVMEWPGR